LGAGLTSAGTPKVSSLTGDRDQGLFLAGIFSDKDADRGGVCKKQDLTSRTTPPTGKKQCLIKIK
jgi:hypothetical protein